MHSVPKKEKRLRFYLRKSQHVNVIKLLLMHLLLLLLPLVLKRRKKLRTYVKYTEATPFSSSKGLTKEERLGGQLLRSTPAKLFSFLRVI